MHNDETHNDETQNDAMTNDESPNDSSGNGDTQRHETGNDDVATPDRGNAATAESTAAHDEAFAAGDSPAREAVPTDPTASLRKELREANERVLRTQAELENFRKRSRREMEDERRYAALPLIRELLGVMDNLERALAASDKGEAAAGLLEGVRMVALQFNACLEQHHCQRIPAVGTSFDPHLHEAIAQQPSAEHPPGTVMHVVRQGYRLHDRVVRPAQVIVSQ